MFQTVMGLLVVLFCVQGFADRKIVYQSTTSGKSTQTEWSLRENGDKISLNGHSDKEDISMECSLQYALESYEEKNPARQIQISKEGACLIIKGNLSGKERLKSYKIGTTPWVQDFKFGLREFLTGPKKEYSFYIVNPKDLDVHEMVATKETEEEVDVEGVSYDTQRVKITLKGFKKKFWKAQVWFDKTDHIMVKYRANEGPRTPYTETVLLSVKS